MINKNSLWFLTLFCLILVLSVYYITMPSELLIGTNGDFTNTLVNKEVDSGEENTGTVSINESSILTALRVSDEETVSKELEELQAVLVNSSISSDEKNIALEKIKDINNNRALEEKLEKQIKDSFKLDSFVKITGDQIRVVISSGEHDNNLANNIMRTVQFNFDSSKYISVKFQS